MATNVTDRDELGRFVSWAKKKGGEAVDNIARGASSAAGSLYRGASKAAAAVAESDAIKGSDASRAAGAVSRVTGSAADAIEEPEEPTYEEPKNMMKKTIVREVKEPPKGPAQKGNYKPWGMEKKKGW